MITVKIIVIKSKRNQAIIDIFCKKRHTHQEDPAFRDWHLALKQFYLYKPCLHLAVIVNKVNLVVFYNQ